MSRQVRFFQRPWDVCTFRPRSWFRTKPTSPTPILR